MSQPEPIVHTMGGGDNRILRFLTDGQSRMEVSGDAPVVSMAKVTADPSTVPSAKSSFFFRLDDSSKWQLCVKFPTGAIQVVVTEP